MIFKSGPWMCPLFDVWSLLDLRFPISQSRMGAGHNHCMSRDLVNQSWFQKCSWELHTSVGEFTVLVFCITGLNSSPAFCQAVLWGFSLHDQASHFTKSPAFCTQVLKPWEVLLSVYETYWSSQLIKFLYHDKGCCSAPSGEEQCKVYKFVHRQLRVLDTRQFLNRCWAVKLQNLCTSLTNISEVIFSI